MNSKKSIFDMTKAELRVEINSRLESIDRNHLKMTAELEAPTIHAAITKELHEEIRKDYDALAYAYAKLEEKL